MAVSLIVMTRLKGKVQMETVLVVDDEDDIVELIQHNLIDNGFSVIAASTGEQAISLSIQHIPDIIVLDLMLPGIGGLEVARYLKNKDKTCEIPIIMVTAKSEESDIIAGLEAGANDYMAKPFSPRELSARVRSILKRQKKGVVSDQNKISQNGDLVIDRNRYLVTINGKSVNLTLTEFDLLSFLAGKKGWVFTRGQIVDAIHGEDYAVTDRSIDVVISGLRKKLKPHSNVIETVRGVGYRFRE